MKTIFNIARAELKALFYSPVAWLILVIFTFQTAIVYTGLYDELVRQFSLGRKMNGITLSTFTGMGGLFTVTQSYLYLYIPLLTMGIMSREYASGSIKLLYSSPLTNYQIIFGKYLALMIYGLVLVGILSVYGIYSCFTIEEVDVPLILTGLLGLYLLICAYSAIGLFMSSITSYTVVAAMGTLAILALLNYVKTFWQEIEFVRDITYWLSISGRSDTFISGLLTSEDILYFLVVVGLFVGFAIVRLQSGRQKASWIVTTGKYTAVFVVSMMIGYLSSKPGLKVFYDSTRTKVNTLTKSSQEVISKLDGALTINTYVNMLEQNFYSAVPSMYKYDVDRFEKYLRFKPDMKIKHFYYYHKADNPGLDRRFPGLNDRQRFDTLSKLYNWSFPVVPYKELGTDADLSKEDFRFVRELVRESGERTFLRVFNDMYVHPFESEITAAFKRLVLDKLPVVGFLTGHGERESNSDKDRGYNMISREKTFRYALINQGFDFTDVTLDRPISDSIRILVIAEPRAPYTEAELAVLNNYIERGGNLIVCGEPKRQELMNQVTAPIGVRFLPGVLVHPSEKFQSDLMLLHPTEAGAAFSYHLDNMLKREQVISMPSAGALEYDSTKGFRVTTLFTSDSTGSWNELETSDFVDDTALYHPAAGETERPYPVVLALSRKVGGKEQKILVTGDADWLSNGELGMNRKGARTSNFALINAAMYWLSDEEVPIDMRREPMPDKSLYVEQAGWTVSKIFIKWVLPLLLAAAGLFIWIRRKGR